MLFKRLGMAAVAASMALAPLSSAGAQNWGLDAVVRTDSGYVAGVGGPVRTFKGIPYAAPPVGALRYAPPQPVKPWDNVRMAKSFSATCMQAEDCLTLNVWTPATPKTSKLPVIVWIHGGGFAIGSSAQPGYDGEVLASQGVVVVSMNYRLNQYGFLAHPELSKENPAGVSGNQGMLDMVQALKWVKANVAGFGGDPNNVTIFGESAGGAAVALLLVMPASEGLFQKAVAASPWQMYQPINCLKRACYGRPAAEADGQAKGALAALRAQPFDARPVNLGQVIVNVTNGTAAYPIVDGVVIPDDPARMFEQGRFHKVPMMVGGNADDGSIAAARVASLAEANALESKRLGGDAQSLLALYGAKDDASAPAATRKMAGDAMFAIAQQQMLRAGAKAGVPTYGYEFARVSPLNRRLNQGATHAADLSYFFGTLPDGAGGGNGVRPGDFDAADQRVASEMMGALVAFARTGSPNAKGLPKWPQFTAADEAYLEWNDKTTVKTHMRAQQLGALWAQFKARMEASAK